MDIARSLLGMVVLLLVAVALSVDRRSIRPRVVLAAWAAQLGIGALVLFVPPGRAALAAAALVVNRVLDYGQQGSEFLFGGLVHEKMFELFGDGGYVFALRVLPMIIFVTSLIAVLYHLGLMRWIVTGLGILFHKLLGVSRIESFTAVTTIFLGQGEIPALVKPFIDQMSGPELFAVMCSGMASIAGSVLAGYAGLGVKMEYLLAASCMAVPGGLLFAKLICPSVGPSRVVIREIRFDEHPPANVIEAAASGAALGLKIAAYVGAMLIAFVGLIALVNGLVEGVAGLCGYPQCNLETLLGYAFAPLAWLIGVPWKDANLAGNFLGQKLILNEFVAYVRLSPYLKDAAAVSAAGLTVLEPRTLAILSFALCGFANFASIAILTGGFGVVSPQRRSEVARYGLRVVAAATLSNLMSGTIAGLFLSLR